nr:hypothetical protein [Tanacetum cinerariifolium]
ERAPAEPLHLVRCSLADDPVWSKCGMEDQLHLFDDVCSAGLDEERPFVAVGSIRLHLPMAVTDVHRHGLD